MKECRSRELFTLKNENSKHAIVANQIWGVNWKNDGRPDQNILKIYFH